MGRVCKCTTALLLLPFSLVLLRAPLSSFPEHYDNILPMAVVLACPCVSDNREH